MNSGLQGSFSLFSYPLYEQFRNDLTSFRDLAAFQANVISTGVRPASAEVARMLRAAYVSGNYFPMLGIRPAAGRLAAALARSLFAAARARERSKAEH